MRCRPGGRQTRHGTLTQVLEPYVCQKANAMVDMFCREGMKHAARSLTKVYLDGSDKQARADMSWTSLLGGLSLANAGLGAVHGLAGPIGGMFPRPMVQFAPAFWLL